MHQFHTDSFPDMISGYDAARMRWERVKPWRGLTGEHDPRPLSAHRSAKTARRNKHMSIRKCKTGEFACRLYDTDVVVYYPNGQISLDTWPSKTTDAFANMLLAGTGIRTAFNSGLGRLVHVDSWEFEEGSGFDVSMERTYNIGAGSYFTPDPRGGWKVETPEPIETWKRDPDEAREARAEYPMLGNFEIWYLALNRLGQLPKQSVDQRAFSKCRISNGEIVRLLEGTMADWITLASHCAPSRVREAIYAVEGVGGICVEIPYIVGGWRVHARIRAGQIKFGGSQRMRRSWR